MGRIQTSDNGFEAVLLATGELEAQLRNQLARVGCRCELLADDPRLPADARQRAGEAYHAVIEAAETVARIADGLKRGLRSGAGEGDHERAAVSLAGAYRPDPAAVGFDE